VKQSRKPALSPIGATLQRVTEELHRVTHRLEKVDDAVGRLVFESASPARSYFHDLQDLDRARQEIAGIASFLERLAREMPEEWLADSKSASLLIDLQELASSLARHEARDSEKAQSAAHECEMF
jgi:hypothetical protein